MPKITNTHRRTEQKCYEDLTNVQHWQRSKKGNLWRMYQGETLAIFQRKDGLFGWSIADSDGPEFSSECYETEEDAIGAVAGMLTN